MSRGKHRVYIKVKNMVYNLLVFDIAKFSWTKSTKYEHLVHFTDAFANPIDTTIYELIMFFFSVAEFCFQ